MHGKKFKNFYLRSRKATVPQRNGPGPATVVDINKSRNGYGQSTAATFKRKNHCTTF